ncbi:ADP-ribose glycohydrolase OARD1-like [Condylostylus longicornis]|uniref:ADP-ribose glycohydrolase OARD1-like n=1 Tax=Condylostylus longicornis TaxID=2530218 RepID=UPI00244E33A1|nr:ADP-ribose glycohydrolase OARD1-like [Condylostylus longicornis]
MEKMRLVEVSGDLFSCSTDFSLAHCVAADLRMGKGIAIKFRDSFGQVGELKRQNVQPGGVAVIKDKNSDRYIYYLVTKTLSYQKPTYGSLASSLLSMKNHMISNNVDKLAMPRIGCGLDGLTWNKVKEIINETFQNENVEIVIYNFVPK